ncbi:unnamed protein product [Symbiodinium sp. CCMP2456]|nr:unnamed protein product [Symbiodinium sp. CCMP2456]
MATVPSQLKNLKVEVHRREETSEKSLVITWEAETPAAVKGFVEYFDPESAMVESDETVPFSREPHRTTAQVDFENERGHFATGACTAKVTLHAAAASLNEAVSMQVTWDDELSKTQAKEDLEKHLVSLQTQLSDMRSNGAGIKILVVGPQHHGKSSLVNHFCKCLSNKLSANDRVNTAPAGRSENTLEVTRISVEGFEQLVLIDTPAIPSMSTMNRNEFAALVDGATQNGTRRPDLLQAETLNPADAAIIVMSLLHWRDEQEEMEAYLQGMTDELKHAWKGKVTFPYVVALTHRDEFLQACQAPKPHRELEAAIQGVQKAANTNHVFALTNYKRGCAASRRVNEATFQLLSQLITFVDKEPESSCSTAYAAASKSTRQWAKTLPKRRRAHVGGFFLAALAFVAYGLFPRSFAAVGP